MLLRKVKTYNANQGISEHLDHSDQTFRLNLHETLTSRVATKSDIFWLPSRNTSNGVIRIKLRGANANIIRTQPN